MRCATAGGLGACGIDGSAAFLYMDDLPFLIHNKRGSIGDSGLFYENAVSGGHFALSKIAQQREGSAKLGGEFLLGRSVVSTNAKNFGVDVFKFRDTSLVRSDFARSTTGKGGRKKRQHHSVLSPETRKGHLPTLSGRQSKVGRHVAFLQLGVRRLDVLG